MDDADAPELFVAYCNAYCGGKQIIYTDSIGAVDVERLKYFEANDKCP